MTSAGGFSIFAMTRTKIFPKCSRFCDIFGLFFYPSGAILKRKRIFPAEGPFPAGLWGVSMDKSKGQKIFGVILKILPFLVIGILVACNWDWLRHLTFEQIVSYTPENLFLAALILIGLYALKSLTVVFPLVALYMAAGVLFPFWPALLINILGLALCASIPYCIGRFSGSGFIDWLDRKFPKIDKLNHLQMNNTLFSAYLLRVVSILPGDVVSMYFGASRSKYFPYLVGSILGLSPIMVIQTLMGENLDDPFSLKFFLLLAAMVLVSLFSSRLFNRRLKEQAKD